MRALLPLLLTLCLHLIQKELNLSVSAVSLGIHFIQFISNRLTHSHTNQRCIRTCLCSGCCPCNRSSHFCCYFCSFLCRSLCSLFGCLLCSGLSCFFCCFLGKLLPGFHLFNTLSFLSQCFSSEKFCSLGCSSRYRSCCNISNICRIPDFLTAFHLA